MSQNNLWYLKNQTKILEQTNRLILKTKLRFFQKTKVQFSKLNYEFNFKNRKDQTKQKTKSEPKQNKEILNLAAFSLLSLQGFRRIFGTNHQLTPFFFFSSLLFRTRSEDCVRKRHLTSVFLIFMRSFWGIRSPLTATFLSSLRF